MVVTRDLCGRCYQSLLLDELEEYAAVIEELSRVIAADPRCVAALNNRGLAYAEAGFREAAERDFAAASKLTRSEIAPLKNWGMALVSYEDLPGALAKFEAASKIDSSDETLHRCIAYVRQRMNGHG